MDLQRSEHGIGRCSTHGDNPAVGVCVSCGAFVCSVCKTVVHGRILCPKCLEEHVTKLKRDQAHGQRGFGIWSISLFAVGFVFLLVNIFAVPETASDTVFTLVGTGILAPSIIGLVLGILGLAQKTGSSRGMCIVGVTLNAALLVLFLFFIIVGLMIGI